MPLFSITDATEQVLQDLSVGFSGIFEGTADLQPVGPFAEEPMGTTSETISILAWEWPVVHVGPLQGTPATNRELTVRGVTVIDGSGTELQFSRYIDWLALYAELGAIAIARPPVEDRRKIEGNVPHPVIDEGPEDPDVI